jgi:hypothetical protein
MIHARLDAHILGQKNVILAKIYHLCGAFKPPLRFFASE